MGLLFLSQHLLRLHRLGSGHRLSPRLLLVDDLFQEGWGRRCGAFLLRWHSIHLLFESAQTFDWLIALRLTVVAPGEDGGHDGTLKSRVVYLAVLEHLICESPTCWIP